MKTHTIYLPNFFPYTHIPYSDQTISHTLQRTLISPLTTNLDIVIAAGVSYDVIVIAEFSFFLITSTNIANMNSSDGFVYTIAMLNRTVMDWSCPIAPVAPCRVRQEQ